MIPRSNIPTVQFEQELAAYFAEQQSQAATPPGGDPGIAAFNEAALQSNATNPAYRALTEVGVALEAVTNPSYRVKKNFTIHQSLLIPDKIRHEVDYPSAFDAERWVDFNREYLSDPRSPQYQQLQRYQTLDLNTNRHKRGAAIAILATAHTLRSNIYWTPPVIHEWGSSNGHILKALALRMLGEIVIVGADNEPDQRYTEKFNLFAHMAPFAKGYGIEAMPPRTDEDFSRLKSATLVPGQLDRDKPKDKFLPGERSHEDDFDMLATAPVPSVKTIRSDMFNLKSRERRTLERNRADFAFLSHALPKYRDQVDRVIAAIMPFMRPTGIIVVNEYATVRPDNNQELAFHDSWYDEPWKCQTIARKIDRPDEGWTSLIEWETAHCEKGRLLEGLVKYVPALAS